MRVEAHVHIGKARAGDKACISVRPLPSGHVYYMGTQYLTDVTFSVQPAGLRKFRQTGQKNVHAYVRGNDAGGLKKAHRSRLGAGWSRAFYNPNKNNTFVDELGMPLYQASKALIIGKDLFYLP